LHKAAYGVNFFLNDVLLVAEKLEWEKQIQQAVKREHRFGVRE